MKFFRKTIVAAGVVAAVSVGTANASTELNGSVYGDDNFTAYLSTSASMLGTAISSGSWGSSVDLPQETLTTGNTYYLQFLVYGAGNPNRLVADLTLSGSDFHFANGSQVLNSGDSTLADFAASMYSGTWKTPSETVFSEGSGQIWYNNPAQPDTVCEYCTIEVMTKISPIGAAGVPEPAGWTLMIAGIGLVGGALRGARAERLADA